MAQETRNARTDPNGGGRFDALDSLRGICACMIVLFHLRSTGAITNAAIVRNGWIFVDFFFVLSGFVIACGYLDRLRGGYSVRRFLLLRLGRIYPLHIVVLAAFFVLELAGALLGTAGLSARAPFSEPRTLPEFAASLALVQVFAGFPGIVWNGPSWSIAAELWTYLLVALSIRAAPRGAAVTAVALALASAALLALAGPAAWNPATAYAFARCVLGFSLGVLAWMLFAATGQPRPGVVFATLAEAMVTILCGAMIAWGRAPLAAPPLFALTVLVFAAQGGLISRLLRLRPFTTLGTLSYSIYLIHTLLIARGLDLLMLLGQALDLPLVQTRLGSTGTIKVLSYAPDLMALAVLGVVLACAWCSYRWIEAPARAATRQWVATRAARPARPTTETRIAREPEGAHGSLAA